MGVKAPAPLGNPAVLNLKARFLELLIITVSHFVEFRAAIGRAQPSEVQRRLAWDKTRESGHHHILECVDGFRPSLCVG